MIGGWRGTCLGVSFDFMDGDRKPNKEGYLNFERTVLDGHEALERRAAEEWLKSDQPNTELGHYYGLHFIEKSIRDHLSIDDKEMAGWYERELRAIGNPGLREDARRLIEGHHSKAVIRKSGTPPHPSQNRNSVCSGR